ncbi:MULTISPECIES: S8 family peptidase [unclassified Micromonospora]|uniref:S8 family peptidase n=1 Tax=unclassified Micromonospora TaxID=2617518 RepID=UPI0010350507|nr:MULTISPECIES: S8 family peptidase [unclassified Micromonospora]QKW13605.1 S8 family peptidase [Verrucosispora sp. NA02020]TBL35216.1 S8 family peptidase [Verrucosispora sp. SN26_14.1]
MRLTHLATRRRLGILGAATLAGALLATAGVNPAAATPVTGTILGADLPTAVAGSYIVVLKDGQQLTRAGAERVTTRYGGGQVDRLYGRTVNGYSATLTERAARRLAADPTVAYVEQNQRVQALATQPNPPSWGLDRIDQRNLPLNQSFTYGPSNGVRIYVVDTGVRISHQDFGGRAVHGYDAVDNDYNTDDGNGHGTFVASVAAGSAYGVAKNATVVGVRVLNNSGSGTTAGVIAGVDWVTANATRPAVANLSLGGGASTTLDAAVRRSINAGITYAIAAGNSGVPATGTSPARVTEALTVGATDRTDTRPTWSNYGTALDLFAPGVSITAAWRTSNTATYTGSGTSFAAPHVAGAAAIYLRNNPSASPATVNAAIVAAATPNVVVNPGAGSPNRLLYIGTFGS